MRRGWALIIALLCVGCGSGKTSPDSGDEFAASETAGSAGTETQGPGESESEGEGEGESGSGSETETETETEESSGDGLEPDLPPPPACESGHVIEGDVGAYDYAGVEMLEGVRCITGNLQITDTQGPVPDLAPLADLEVVGGTLSIGLTDSLVGLDSLTTVGGLEIDRAPPTALAGLESLVSIGSEGLTIEPTMPVGDLLGLEGLAWVDGDVYLTNVESTDGLAALTHVGGDLWFVRNPELLELDGLAGIAEFDGRLIIGINGELVDIGGLAELPSATRVYVFNNPHLSTCAVLDLIAGLEPLEHRFVAGNDDSLCQPAEPCAAMDAHPEGACEAVVGPIWNGSNCNGGSGCSAEGMDSVVVDLWANEVAWCEVAFAGCL